MQSKTSNPSGVAPPSASSAAAHAASVASSTDVLSPSIGHAVAPSGTSAMHWSERRSKSPLPMKRTRYSPRPRAMPSGCVSAKPAKACASVRAAAGTSRRSK